jgi:hypothetical protein
MHTANPAVDPVRFAHWTLRDEAAQRRLCQTFKLYKNPFLDFFKPSFFRQSDSTSDRK